MNWSRLMRTFVVLALVMMTTHAMAGDRRFAYTYEVTTNPPGTFEYEQFVTWKASKKSDRDFDRIEFRHELEWGLTDHLQIGVYLADWRYQDGKSVSKNESEYRDTAVELIWNLTDPVEDVLGVALYGEVKVGDELFELEGKILLQKNFGPFVVAYNAIIEAEWEDHNYDRDKGEFGQTFGISYEVTPQFLVGVEAVHEIEFNDWEQTGDHVVYVGPNMSFRSKSNWWFTVAPLFQVTDVDGEADFQTRLLVGFHF